MEKDYYKILGVSYSATQEEIRNAYLKIVKKYHPDICKDKNATLIMQNANEAYKVLSNLDGKKEYDRTINNYGFSQENVNNNKVGSYDLKQYIKYRIDVLPFYLVASQEVIYHIFETEFIPHYRTDIFKTIGCNSAMTDFSILLGGYVYSNIYTRYGNDLSNRIGLWWTSESLSLKMKVIRPYTLETGIWKEMKDTTRYVSTRPSIKYSLIQNYCSKEKLDSLNLLTVKYGEYPQMICDKKMSSILQSEYNKGSLIRTGKQYTIDSSNINDEDPILKPKMLDEYIYNGKKFIRYIANQNSAGKVLSNGEVIKLNKAYFLKVEPITWLVDKKADIALSKKLLFSNIPYCNYGIQSHLKYFLSNYFIYEAHKDLSNVSDLEQHIENNIENDNAFKKVLRRIFK